MPPPTGLAPLALFIPLYFQLGVENWYYFMSSSISSRLTHRFLDRSSARVGWVRERSLHVHGMQYACRSSSDSSSTSLTALR
ncbi:hypothetical protein OE88DRAFT_1657379 [Heliocybe sulcata]|uniref:Uncharacterized protein n=1 Tax=Heliocybe sulcata TaxID=5364 RepID=A0A5C3N5V5_9AGAM|nr:hypothetical protein OE88DRAFT_1657379 [Heliocybe sulcata]